MLHRCGTAPRTPNHQRLAATMARLGLASCLGIGAAVAAVPAVAVPDSQDFSASSGASVGPVDFLNSYQHSAFLLGNMFGLRTWMSRYGASLGVEETSEVLGNVTGGYKRGFEYDGLMQAALQVDSSRALGIYGGTFNASGLWLQGRNLSVDHLGTLQTASGISGDRAVRLWELWYQQKFLEEDRLDIRVGQQSIDQEFMFSQNASYFVNTMMGWPMLPSADMPGGGPAYPLSALGVRLRVRPADPITILAGVYNGAPAYDTSVDAQKNNPYGLSFPLNGGVLAIAELQFAYPSLGSMVSPDHADPLSCLYKIGFWYDSEDFDDQRYDTSGLSLADPNTTGTPQSHRGNYSGYVVGDQMIWHAAEDSDRNINLFLRAMYTPKADRNLIAFSVNGGLTFHEPIRHRDDDTFGLGFGYTRVSTQASGLDQDTATVSGTSYPVRSGETFVEATYQYEVFPWWQLQPDVQYVIKPGAGIPNPDGSGDTVKNELVLGIRTNVIF